MPIEKSRPSSTAKADTSKKTVKSAELGDDELRRVSGGMANAGNTGSTPPVCVSQT